MLVCSVCGCGWVTRYCVLRVDKVVCVVTLCWLGCVYSLFSSAHGSSLRTCAEDLIKFGTTVSTAEPLLGKHHSVHVFTFIHTCICVCIQSLGVTSITFIRCSTCQFCSICCCFFIANTVDSGQLLHD